MFCSRVQNMLSAYCDRELTGAEMLRVRSHLAECAACQREHREMLHVKRLFGALAEVLPPQPFESQLLQPRRLQLGRMFPVARLFSLGRPIVWNAHFDTAVARLGLSTQRLALAGALSVAVLCLAVLQQPQHSDTISAHLLGSVAAEDAEAEVGLPPREPTYYPTFAVSRFNSVPPIYGAPAEPARTLPVALISTRPDWGGR